MPPGVAQMMRSEFAFLESRAAPADDDNGALYDAFEHVFPVKVRMALIKNNNIDSSHVSLPPEAQWLYTIMHAWSASYKKPGGYHCRFTFQDRAHDELLVLDVHAVLRCPEDGSVPHGPEPERTVEELMQAEGCSEAEAMKRAALSPGTEVILTGLSSRPDLNGARGVVKSVVDLETVRYCVELKDGGGGGGGGGGDGAGRSFNLKHANLQREGSQYERDAPLVLVRFLHMATPARSSEQRLASFHRQRSASFRDGWLAGGADCVWGGGPDMHVMRAESVDDLRAGLAELERHEALLSEDYRTHFRALSPHHRGGGGGVDFSWRPSFLVPPLHVPCVNKLEKELYRCANHPVCGIEAADAQRFTTCSKCRSALYCGKACQRAHWARHKLVCGKSALELDAPLAAAGKGRRPSFVFAIDCCPPVLRLFPPGWPRDQRRRELAAELARPGASTFSVMETNLNVSSKSGMFREVKADLEDVPMPKNMHGDDEFVVKVQVPVADGAPVKSEDGGGAAGWPARCMVYDRRKTFGDQFFCCDTPEKHRAFKLVRTGRFSGGLKGYFMARREGTNVRVYTDRVLPTPSPPW